MIGPTSRAAAALTLLACVPASLAQFGYTAQQRTIFGFASDSAVFVPTTLPAPAGAAVKTAPDFAPWIDSASMTVPADSSTNSGAANINSTLGTHAITISGGASGSDAYPFSGAGVGSGLVSAVIDFTLASSHPYSAGLSGTFSGAQSGSRFHAQFSLVNTGTSATIFSGVLPFMASPPPWALNFGGTLPAGSYRYTVLAYGGGGGTATSSGGVNFQSSLQVPAPAAGGLIALAAGVMTRRRR